MQGIFLQGSVVKENAYFDLDIGFILSDDNFHETAYRLIDRLDINPQRVFYNITDFNNVILVPSIYFINKVFRRIDLAFVKASSASCDLPDHIEILFDKKNVLKEITAVENFPKCYRTLSNSDYGRITHNFWMNWYEILHSLVKKRYFYALSLFNSLCFYHLVTFAYLAYRPNKYLYNLYTAKNMEVDLPKSFLKSFDKILLQSKNSNILIKTILLGSLFLHLEKLTFQKYGLVKNDFSKHNYFYRSSVKKITAC